MRSLMLDSIPAVGSVINGETVVKRQKSRDGKWRVLLGEQWQPIEVQPTLTAAHIELLAGNDCPERQEAVATWATTPHEQRCQVIEQLPPDEQRRVLQALRACALFHPSDLRTAKTKKTEGVWNA